MSDLPGGTVTLVFTDIEGSTRLLASLGSRYEEVLAAHRRHVREAFSSHGGLEVDTQADALLHAFARDRVRSRERSRPSRVCPPMTSEREWTRFYKTAQRQVNGAMHRGRQ